MSLSPCTVSSNTGDATEGKRPCSDHSNAAITAHVNGNSLSGADTRTLWMSVLCCSWHYGWPTVAKTMQMRDHNEISIVSGNSKKEGGKKKRGWGGRGLCRLSCYYVLCKSTYSVPSIYFTSLPTQRVPGLTASQWTWLLFPPDMMTHTVGTCSWSLCSTKPLSGEPTLNRASREKRLEEHSHIKHPLPIMRQLRTSILNLDVQRRTEGKPNHQGYSLWCCLPQCYMRWLHSISAARRNSILMLIGAKALSTQELLICLFSGGAGGMLMLSHCRSIDIHRL